ncbi:uncharacterized protein LOC129744501 [Uranotaenia lowii]|uniref:uncharacterized protein LOC129744501 n=1 Tax=Uranotaenia lowii TaxID=190385 RepID=UPI00247AEEDC|nr:uncharacterized protein LOC129744501 [Uranotaenia lowii]
MDEEYDIYGDLETFEAEAEKENKVVQDLNAQIEALKTQIEEKETEKQVIAGKNEILLENISSLLLTAKAELKRKDALIADIRREKDNALFRRGGGSKPPRMYDKYTQTGQRMISSSVQTEEVKPKPRKEDPIRARSVVRGVVRARSISRSKSRVFVKPADRTRENGWRTLRERSQIRDRLRSPSRVGSSRFDKSRAIPDRKRERERELERKARRERRSPSFDGKRRPYFKSPIRVAAEEDSVPDSASDIEKNKPLIPMNTSELDRFVKEIGRPKSRSPKRDTCMSKRNYRDHLPLTDSAPWNSTKQKRDKENKKQTKEVSKSIQISKIKQETEVIQSDEIGTTASGSGVSPNKHDDSVEQKLLLLHGTENNGTPKALNQTMQTPSELLAHLNNSAASSGKPASTFESPLPPPIVAQQFPAQPLERPPIKQEVPIETLVTLDDENALLNDSRELKIVECEDLPGKDEKGQEKITSQEVNGQEELEDGEVLSPKSLAHEIDLEDVSLPDFEAVRSQRSDRSTNHNRVLKSEVVSKTIDHSSRTRRSSLRDNKQAFSPSKSKQKSRTVSEKSDTYSSARGSSTRSHRNRKKSDTFKDLFGSDDANSVENLEAIKVKLLEDEKRRIERELGQLEVKLDIKKKDSHKSDSKVTAEEESEYGTKEWKSKEVDNKKSAKHTKLEKKSPKSKHESSKKVEDKPKHRFRSKEFSQTEGKKIKTEKSDDKPNPQSTKNKVGNVDKPASISTKNEIMKPVKCEPHDVVKHSIAEKTEDVKQEKDEVVLRIVKLSSPLTSAQRKVEIEQKSGSQSNDGSSCEGIMVGDTKKNETIATFEMIVRADVVEEQMLTTTEPEVETVPIEQKVSHPDFLDGQATQPICTEKVVPLFDASIQESKIGVEEESLPEKHISGNIERSNDTGDNQNLRMVIEEQQIENVAVENPQVLESKEEDSPEVIVSENFEKSETETTNTVDPLLKSELANSSLILDLTTDTVDDQPITEQFSAKRKRDTDQKLSDNSKKQKTEPLHKEPEEIDQLEAELETISGGNVSSVAETNVLPNNEETVMKPPEPVIHYISPVKQMASPQQPYTESPSKGVCSTKFSEYRIEVVNETEATVYLTRKKKKKSKSKDVSLNTSGGN